MFTTADKFMLHHIHRRLQSHQCQSSSLQLLNTQCESCTHTHHHHQSVNTQTVSHDALPSLIHLCCQLFINSLTHYMLPQLSIITYLFTSVINSFIRSFFAGRGPAYSVPQCWDHIVVQCAYPGRGRKLVVVSRCVQCVLATCGEGRLSRSEQLVGYFCSAPLLDVAYCLA